MEHRFAARVRTHRARELPIGALKPSAVMLLIEERTAAGQANREECVVFQLRTHNVRFHKGEISLPGGRLDPDDQLLVDGQPVDAGRVIVLKKK